MHSRQGRWPTVAGSHGRPHNSRPFQMGREAFAAACNRLPTRAHVDVVSRQRLRQAAVPHAQQRRVVRPRGSKPQREGGGLKRELLALGQRAQRRACRLVGRVDVWVGARRQQNSKQGGSRLAEPGAQACRHACGRAWRRPRPGSVHAGLRTVVGQRVGGRHQRPVPSLQHRQVAAADCEGSGKDGPRGGGGAWTRGATSVDGTDAQTGACQLPQPRHWTTMKHWPSRMTGSSAAQTAPDANLLGRQAQHGRTAAHPTPVDWHPPSKSTNSTSQLCACSSAQ